MRLLYCCVMKTLNKLLATGALLSQLSGSTAPQAPETINMQDMTHMLAPASLAFQTDPQTNNTVANCSKNPGSSMTAIWDPSTFAEPYTFRSINGHDEEGNPRLELGFTERNLGSGLIAIVTSDNSRYIVRVSEGGRREYPLDSASRSYRAMATVAMNAQGKVEVALNCP